MSADVGTAPAPVIDLRVRPPFGEFLSMPHFGALANAPQSGNGNGLEATRTVSRSATEASLELFFEEMTRAGVVNAVVQGRWTAARGRVSNDEVARLLLAHPNRFIGFGSLGPDVENHAAELRRCMDLGFKGMLFEPTMFDPAQHVDDAAFDGLYRQMESAGTVLMLLMSIFVGPDLSWSHPIRLQRILERFPGLKVVVSHCCWPEVDTFLGLAFRYPNLYALPDLYGNIPGTHGKRSLVDAANTFLSKRTLFGSTYPVRSIEASVREFREWPFATEEIRRDCLHDNAARLLGL
jgi:predicted TIM-barrel fold metal-dependent hydrolase